jgi:hypothetical protein
MWEAWDLVSEYCLSQLERFLKDGTTITINNANAITITITNAISITTVVLNLIK